MRLRGGQVSIDPSGLAVVTSTDVQGAIGELDAASGGGGGGGGTQALEVQHLHAVGMSTAQSGFNIIVDNGLRLQSDGAQNSYVEYQIYLPAGTWALDLQHDQVFNRGIYTVSIDGSSVGTIDGYAGGTTQTRSTITGITVGSAGWKALRLTMATKNGSSSAYYGVFSLIVLRKTA